MLDSAPFRKFIKEYKKSEIIFEENSNGTEMYVVNQGKVELSTKAPGKEVVLATLGPGEFFGEMALCDSAPRTATAIAAEDGTRLIVLDQNKFLALVSRQPTFALNIMHVLCRRIRERWSLYDELINNATEKGRPSEK